MKTSLLILSFGFTLLLWPRALAAQSAANASDNPRMPMQHPGQGNLSITVRLLLSETISSASAKVGQVVMLEVPDAVQAEGRVLIAPGALAQATVTTSKRRGHNSREGRLVLTIKSVKLVDGTDAPLQSAPLQKGSGKGEPIFGPCTFPIPADPAGLFRKGNDVVIPKGTEILASISLRPQ